MSPKQRKRAEKKARCRKTHEHKTYVDENGNVQTDRCFRCRPMKRPSVATVPQRIRWRT